MTSILLGHNRFYKKNFILYQKILDIYNLNGYITYENMPVGWKIPHLLSVFQRKRRTFLLNSPNIEGGRMSDNKIIRANFYIDGYNFYNGIVAEKRRDLLWIDMFALLQTNMEPDMKMHQVFYFTSEPRVI